MPIIIWFARCLKNFVRRRMPVLSFNLLHLVLSFNLHFESKPCPIGTTTGPEPTPTPIGPVDFMNGMWNQRVITSVCVIIASSSVCLQMVFYLYPYLNVAVSDVSVSSALYIDSLFDNVLRGTLPVPWPLCKVLRILCIKSLCNNGLPKKEFELYRNEILEERVRVRVRVRFRDSCNSA